MDRRLACATIDTPSIALSFSQQTVTISDGATTRTLHYMRYDCLTTEGMGCSTPTPGPNGTVVVTDYFGRNGGDPTPVQCITHLTDASANSWDIPRTYIGPLGDELLVRADRGGRFQIAIITP